MFVCRPWRYCDKWEQGWLCGVAEYNTEAGEAKVSLIWTYT